jgi:hypothetical protein
MTFGGKLPILCVHNYETAGTERRILLWRLTMEPSVSVPRLKFCFQPNLLYRNILPAGHPDVSDVSFRPLVPVGCPRLQAARL